MILVRLPEVNFNKDLLHLFLQNLQVDYHLFEKFGNTMVAEEDVNKR